METNSIQIKNLQKKKAKGFKKLANLFKIQDPPLNIKLYGEGWLEGKIFFYDSTNSVYWKIFVPCDEIEVKETSQENSVWSMGFLGNSKWSTSATLPSCIFSFIILFIIYFVTSVCLPFAFLILSFTCLH
jgi:hypothetical protein